MLPVMNPDGKFLGEKQTKTETVMWNVANIRITKATFFSLNRFHAGGTELRLSCRMQRMHLPTPRFFKLIVRRLGY